MESEGLALCSSESATCRCPEPDDSSSSKESFKLLRQNQYVGLFLPMCATCRTQLIPSIWCDSNT
jgi:hypothetical protein